MKTYVVTVQRSNGWWSFSIPEIEGAFGQAKRLEQVESEASDVICLMTDKVEGTFAVTLDVRLDPDTERLIEQAKRLRADLIKAQERAATAVQEAVEQAKTKAELSMRDIGRLLDMSFQRIAQLVNSLSDSVGPDALESGRSKLKEKVGRK
jgi:predicted RNase H-like HicB family nuclease